MRPLRYAATLKILWGPFGMSDYFGLFFDTPEQIFVLGASLVLWIAFSAAGALVLRGDRLIEADVISGWAVANLALTIGGVFTGIPFSWMAIALGLFGAFAVYVNMRDGVRFSVPALPMAAIVALPLILLASAMRGSQWDEFTDWLLIPKYLFHFGHFPSEEFVYESASFPAYPFGWHYVTYLTAELTRGFREAVAPVFNILLLLATATLIVRLVARALEKENIVIRPTWPIVAIAVAAVTLLNPTFVQKIVITSYADTSTAVVTAFAAVIGWMLVEALTVADRRRARRLAIQLGLSLAVLINLKQATLALFLLLAAAPFLIAFRDRLIPLKEIFRYAAYILIPPLVIYFSWRHHVNTEIMRGEFPIRPIAEWYWDIAPDILWRMIVILSKKGYYFACILIVIALGLRALFRCKTSEDRLLIIAAFTILGYNGFLFVAYLASFPRGESIVAASFWRYNHHLGCLAIVTVAYLVAARFGPALTGFFKNRRALAYIPLILIVAAPLAFAEKLRFDKLPVTQHFRTVGADSRALLPESAHFMVFDPAGDGESAHIAMYEMSGRQHFKGYRAAYHKFDIDDIRQAVRRYKVEYVIVHSANDVVRTWLGLQIDRELSYLLQRDGDGWRVIHTWQWPSDRGKYGG